MIRKFIDWNRSLSGIMVAKFPGLFDSRIYNSDLLLRIKRDLEYSSIDHVLEIGGIDRPLLKKGSGYRYVGIDIEEKPQCFEIYDEFVVQSIEEKVDGQYGCVISTCVLEHVPNNDMSFENIFAALKEGGVTHHYIPSKNNPYSWALRLVGPKIQKTLIPILRPEAVEVAGYPAYFDCCSPSALKKLLIRKGFKDIEIVAYYDGAEYFSFFFPAFVVLAIFENICRSFGFEAFASGFIVSAKK